ncbi:MAG: S1C family serine protease [Defluviitaleaceae bacterium]|nr:S1C family serine protease [Defluviitaleaceae bacterium]
MKKVMLAMVVLTAVVVFSACSRLMSILEEDQLVTGPVAVVDIIPAEPPHPVVTPQPPLSNVVLTPAQIFDKNKNAVIQIVAFCEDDWTYFGSGFIIDANGTAVTNHHVMANMVEAWAVLYDGREIEISGFFSYDIGNDLAIIQVGTGAESFQYVTMGDAYAMSVGEPVFAVGGPEGDPLTFTDGMISRFANEPVSFGIYTIEGMLQSTAAIYGGNSGGPLLNDRGHVIGINSAGRPDRPSVQWAVPINRVDVPTAASARSPLPIGGRRATQERPAQQATHLARFNFIPDLAFTSHNATLLMSGTPVDLGETSGLFYELYDYLVIYHIPERHWVPDTDRFDIVLREHGFVMQNVVPFGTEIWVYFFHPTRNISLSYVYFLDFDTLLVGIVDGNVYWEFYHAGPSIPDNLELDSSLIGVWEFIYTTSETYIVWSEAGEYIFYAFDADGTGQFATFNAAGDIIREFDFNWGTHNFELVITYTDIDLVLVYPYEYDTQYGLLFLGYENDGHVLAYFPLP